LLVPVLLSSLIAGTACDSGLGPNDVANVIVSPSSNVLQVGMGVQLTATALAQDGTNVPGLAPSWRSSDSTIATVDQSGLVSTRAAGSATVTATVAGKSGTASITAVTGGGSLRKVSGDGQRGTVTDTLAEPLVVRVRDSEGTPRPGIPVTFVIPDQVAQVTAGVVNTDAEGIASTVVILGSQSGTVLVSVTAIGSSENATFGVFADPDTPAQLVVTQGNAQVGFTGHLLEDSVAVALLDRFGNPIRDSVVQWVVTAGGGAPSAPTSIADGGRAAIRWTLGGSPGPNTLEARFAGLAPAVLSALAVFAGPGTVTFSSVGFPPYSMIVTMPPDGIGSVTLPGSVTGDIDGDWSKDRSRIALANADENPAEASGFNDFTDLVVMNAGGSGRTRLTHHFGSVSGPAWSPDGSKIAFASDQSGRSEVYVVDADGSHLVQLTTTGGLAPSWSPDGTRLAVGIKITDVLQEPSAFVMDAADGGNVVPLMPGEDPAWSPDGSVIALATCPTVVCDPDGYQLTLIHPDGTGAVVLAPVTGAHEPAWAPDGSRIALRREMPGHLPGGIYTINPDGSGIVHLSGPSGNFPSWGP
jgi:hypothetical protein